MVVTFLTVIPRGSVTKYFLPVVITSYFADLFFSVKGEMLPSKDLTIIPVNESDNWHLSISFFWGH